MTETKIGSEDFSVIDDSKPESLLKPVVVNKYNRDGAPTQTWTVTKEQFKGNVYGKITQVKYAFGTNPGKTASITLDVSNKELKEAISEVFKK